MDIAETTHLPEFTLRIGFGFGSCLLTLLGLGRVAVIV